MKRASPAHKQQLNSTGICDDSVVIDNGITDEVANKEKKAIRNNKRILIVDDEGDITFTLRIILEENGFKEVDVFNEPLLALQNAKSRVYSILITDVAMPIMDGCRLYEKIKKMDQAIKVFLVTASEVNYEALKELFPTYRLDISDDEDKATTLQGGRKGDEERIHFRWK